MSETNNQDAQMEEQVPFKPYSFNTLLLVKSAQNQNGLRHNDYNRYHQYCSRKMLRLRKMLKYLQQGGNKSNVK
jgi:signal recognition particle subunit SRP68